MEESLRSRRVLLTKEESLSAVNSHEEADISQERRKTRQLTGWDKKKRIWIIYVVGFMDLFGVSMMIPFLPKLARNVGASPTVAGLIGSLYGALQVLSSPVVGQLSDVYGRRQILLLAYLAPCVGYFMMSRADSVFFLVLSRLLPGFLKHGLSVSKAYLTDITDDTDRRSVLGLFNALSSLGFIFGPLISGYLADIDPSLRLSISFGAIVYGLDLVLVMFFVPPVEPVSASKRESKGTISLKTLYESVNVFKGLHVKGMVDILLVRFLLTFALIMFRTNFPTLLDTHFNAGGSTLGKILALNGIISAASAASCGYVSSFYSNTIKQVIHFSILLMISLICSTLSPSLFLVALFLVPMALSTSTLRICMLSLMLQRGRDEERGAIIGIGAAMASISRMLAPGIVGVAQEYGGEAVGYLCVGLTLMAVAVLLGYSSRQKSDSTKYR